MKNMKKISFLFSRSENKDKPKSRQVISNSNETATSPDFILDITQEEAESLLIKLWPEHTTRFWLVRSNKNVDTKSDFPLIVSYWRVNGPRTVCHEPIKLYTLSTIKNYMNHGRGEGIPNASNLSEEELLTPRNIEELTDDVTGLETLHQNFALKNLSLESKNEETNFVLPVTGQEAFKIITQLFNETKKIYWLVRRSQSHDNDVLTVTTWDLGSDKTMHAVHYQTTKSDLREIVTELNGYVEKGIKLYMLDENCLITVHNIESIVGNIPSLKNIVNGIIQKHVSQDNSDYYHGMESNYHVGL